MLLPVATPGPGARRPEPGAARLRGGGDRDAGRAAPRPVVPLVRLVDAALRLGRARDRHRARLARARAPHRPARQDPVGPHRAGPAPAPAAARRRARRHPQGPGALRRAPAGRGDGPRAGADPARPRPGRARAAASSTAAPGDGGPARVRRGARVRRRRAGRARHQPRPVARRGRREPGLRARRRRRVLRPLPRPRRTEERRPPPSSTRSGSCTASGSRLAAADDRRAAAAARARRRQSRTAGPGRSTAASPAVRWPAWLPTAEPRPPAGTALASLLDAAEAMARLPLPVAGFARLVGDGAPQTYASLVELLAGDARRADLPQPRAPVARRARTWRAVWDRLLRDLAQRVVCPTLVHGDFCAPNAYVSPRPPTTRPRGSPASATSARTRCRPTR